MDLKEATNKIKAFASGKLAAVTDSYTILSDGTTLRQCSVFVNGIGHVHGETFKQCFEEIDRKISENNVDKLYTDDEIKALSTFV